mmetsp:Transcript_17152/g.29434  ORF Transcript_17152/g.29434 Transcript_17152/m.29434 type:complete len:260 (+) Transcript_17152:95-874(+)
MCCESLVKCVVRDLLWFLNTTFFFVGCLLIATAVYMLKQFKNTQDIYFLQTDVTYGVLATGIIVAVVAVFGCCCGAAKHSSSCARTSYAIVLLILLVVQGVFVLSCLEFTGDIHGTSLSGKVEDAVICTYKVCCKSMHLPIKGCEINPDLCPELPSVFTSDENCALSSKDYEEEIADWAQDNLEPALIVVCVIFAAQLLAIVFSCCLACLHEPSRRTLFVNEVRHVEHHHHHIDDDAPMYARLADEHTSVHYVAPRAER